MNENILAFDIGGTEIKYGVISVHGDILFNASVETPEVGDDIIELLKNLKQEIAKKFSIKGASFSMPGFVIPESGYLKTAGAINDFYGLNFIEVMQEKFQLPVEVENDVNCVALAERWVGSAKNCQNFLCLNIGTGVGGAIMMNDRLIHGHGHMAGEFGYMLTRNFFEQSDASKTLSFTGSVRESIRRPYFDKKALEDFSTLSGKDVFDAAENGDVDAQEIISCFYQHLAAGIYNLTFILNPEKIIIGGAISQREDLIEKIHANFELIIAHDSGLAGFTTHDLVSLEKASLGNDAGMIGAAYHFITMQPRRSDNQKKQAIKRINNKGIELCMR